MSRAVGRLSVPKMVSKGDGMSFLPEWLTRKRSGPQVHGMWQLGFGASMCLLFVVIPVTADYTINLLKERRRNLGEGRNTIAELVYQRRVEVRKEASGDTK